MTYYWPSTTHVGEEYTVQPGENDCYPIDEPGTGRTESVLLSATPEAALLGAILATETGVDSVYLYTSDTDPNRTRFGYDETCACFEVAQFYNEVTVEFETDIPISENLRTMVDVVYEIDDDVGKGDAAKQIIPEFCGALG